MLYLMVWFFFSFCNSFHGSWTIFDCQLFQSCSKSQFSVSLCVSSIYQDTALPVLCFPTNITKTQMNSPRHLFNSEVFRRIPSQSTLSSNMSVCSDRRSHNSTQQSVTQNSWLDRSIYFVDCQCQFIDEHDLT